LSGDGQTFILLENYTGRVVTAGRDANVDIYLNQIRVVPGPAIQVKAIELQFDDQPVADALDQIYQMQQEPGLQHIFVSGDIVVSDTAGDGESLLRADYAQNSVRKVRAYPNGHYGLQYLTAAEFIGLANVQVANGDLVVVATYVSPAAGPTATPLPSPPPVSEAGQ
jgi:hypothetical protein